MDGLQDVVADAQYYMAMNTDNPKPTMKFAEVPKDKMEALKSDLRAKGDYTLDWSCTYPVGFLLFIKWLEKEGETSAAQFALACARYKDIPIESERKKQGVEMCNKWFKSKDTRKSKKSSSVRASVISIARRSSVQSGRPSAKVGELAPPPPPPGSSSEIWSLEFGENDLSRKIPAVDADQIAKLYDAHVKKFEDQPPQTAAVPIDVNAPAPAGASLNLDPETVGDSTSFDKADAVLFKYFTNRYWAKYEQTPEFARVLQFHFLQNESVSEKDFTQFRILGKGGFGLVYGCRKNTTGTMYAMKTMGKARVKKKKSEQLCLNERMALNEANSPFVVCLKYAYATPYDLYLIIDLMMGGDLNYWLNEKHTFSQDEARYYSARTLLGIKHLHELGMVYRDLKPENILMDELGRTRISDLGLACKVTPELRGTCGTRGYMAPEMLKRDEEGQKLYYNETVDWFSFGCVLYEFLHGKSPFRSNKAKKYKPKGDKADKAAEKAEDDDGDDDGGDKKKKKKDKKKGKGGKNDLDPISLATLEMDIEYPEEQFDGPTKKFCKRLLDRDPEKRLGAKGGTEIMEHAWFTEHIDWMKVTHDLMSPPFQAGKDIHAASASDIGEFDPVDDVKLAPEDHDVYKEWNHISALAFQCEAVDFLKAEIKEKEEKAAPNSKGGKASGSEAKKGGGGCIIL